MRIHYTPRPDASPEAEIECLANVYAFLLRCHENREAAGTEGGSEGGKAAEHAGAEETASVQGKP